MRRLPIIVLLAAGLAGCASDPVTVNYGNYAQVAIPSDGKSMADDMAKKLVTLYPPARTRFNLRQATPDAFGASLVAALRTKGYALAEFKADAGTGAPVKTLPAVAKAGQVGDVSLAYVVDQPLDSGLYRVTVVVNSQSLTRLYSAKDGAIAPAGYWIRKE